MSGRSRTSAGDHSRSAMAAMRGQMRESIVSGETNSLHMQASPPRMCLRSSAVSVLSAGTGSFR
jgi:hypothetical protein